MLSGKDGIDPDCAKDVTIENCFVMAKDDAIVVKTRKPPATTERVKVHDCIVASDASALKIGTETRALIRDVLFENCEVFDSDRGIIMYARDGGPIENVRWKNIRIQVIHWPHETGGAPFQFLITRRGGATPVRDCLVENVVTNAIVSSGFAGLPDAPLEGLILKCITINVEPPRNVDKRRRQYLLDVQHNVRMPIEDLRVIWNDQEKEWAGITSGPGLDIRNPR